LAARLFSGVILSRRGQVEAREAIKTRPEVGYRRCRRRLVLSWLPLSRHPDAWAPEARRRLGQHEFAVRR
jgi:hypothetical protein